HRLPRMMEAGWRREARELLGQPAVDEPLFNLVVPRSRCPRCEHPIRWHENIPVLGWLALKGRCSQCGAAIGKRYPVIEVLAAVVAALCAWRFGYGWWLVFMLGASF